MKYAKYFLLTLAVIVLDQAVKLLVHFNMEPGDYFRVFGDWFKIYYTLNEGMAFGWKIAGEYGKLVLTLFRIMAMFIIAWYLYHLAKKQVHQGFLWCIALILGGAIGNVLDSTFYGILLDNAPASAPTPWFHGQVVDMFYFDICHCKLPEWLPEFLGGGTIYPLWPIFNIADAAIFMGVLFILIFQGKFFKKMKNNPSDESTPANSKASETETTSDKLPGEDSEIKRS